VAYWRSKVALRIPLTAKQKKERFICAGRTTEEYSGQIESSSP